MATVLWGGRYSPIIPVGHPSASSLPFAFQVDCLVALQDTAEISEFISGQPHLTWPSMHGGLFINGEDGVLSTALDVSEPIQECLTSGWHLKEGVVPTVHSTRPGDPLGDIVRITHGAFPDAKTIGMDFARLFNRLQPKRIDLSNDDNLPADGDRILSPLDMSGYSLEPFSLGFAWRYPGFYAGHSDDFFDLVTFWNLRAAYADLTFYDARFASRLAASIELQKERLASSNGPARHHASQGTIWTRSNDMQTDYGPLGDGLVIRRVDDDQGWSDHGLWPATFGFEEKTVLGTIGPSIRGSGESVSFQLPEKPFEIEPRFPPRLLVASVWSYNNSANRIICPPYLPKLNDFYGHHFHFKRDMIRSERSSLGIIIDEDESDLSLNFLDGRSLISKVFELQSIEASVSEAGKVGLRLIEQMGGIQKCRVFKIPGVRALIGKYGPLKSFTRSEAIQTIRGLNPINGDVSFAAHENLYIEQREERNLTPEAALKFMFRRNMFRVGLEFDCPNCQLSFWVSLDAAKSQATCEYCESSFNVLPYLRDRDWRFRRSGLFGRDDHQAGGIPVALTLQQLDANLRARVTAWSPGMNLRTVVPDGRKCETDFVMLLQEQRGTIQIVIGECKSAGEITAHDIDNMTSIARRFEASGITTFVLFSKLTTFTTDELARFGAIQGYLGARLILLSGRELEPYHVFERSQATRQSKRSGNSLDALASGSREIYLGKNGV